MKHPQAHFAAFLISGKPKNVGDVDLRTPIIRPWYPIATLSKPTSAAARGIGGAEVRDIGTGRGGGNIKGRVAFFKLF
jgi:hypothetical protein